MTAIIESRGGSTNTTQRGQRLQAEYQRVRSMTEALAAPLSPEDCVAQSMPDASPTKWHMAHTTWFFETFVLAPRPDYRLFDESFRVLFNSYYQTIGAQHPRAQRGLVTRPSLDRVREYRAHVDERISRLLLDAPGEDPLRLVTLGLAHEQQHQELLLTDIKHLLSRNPGLPAYRKPRTSAGTGSDRLDAAVRALAFRRYTGGVREIGHSGEAFAFDNESPRHRVYVQPFGLGMRLATCSEWREFINDRGYQRPELWLSDGWEAAKQEDWKAPLYWYWPDDDRMARPWLFSLEGPRPVRDDEPVCHVSYYEADAFARWSRKRLPTEAEWELAAFNEPPEGNFLESNHLHPASDLQIDTSAPHQLFGDVWEWTSSPYVAYPGFTAADGALGEYNGKFMCNQFVLRGGSCLTPRGHVRATYRNFFSPSSRWQFTGVRLAQNA